MGIIVLVFAIFGGALMKIFGFTYQSVGSIILFFTVSGMLSFPIELFVKAIPKVLFSHFAKINAFEAKVLFVVSLVMALLCMNDVIENKER